MERQLQHIQPRQRESLRPKLVRQLRSAVEDAQRAKGTDLMLSLGASYGTPLAASCLVSVLEVESAQLSAQLAELGGDSSMVEVAGRGAIRRLVHRHDPVVSRQLAALAGIEEPSGSGTAVLELGFFVPLPASDHQLLFSFNCVVEPIFVAMERLFDAIMSTFRWVY